MPINKAASVTTVLNEISSISESTSCGGMCSLLTDLVRLGAETNPDVGSRQINMVQHVISRDNTARMIADYQALGDAMVQLAELANIVWLLHGVQSSISASSGQSVSSSDWPIRLAKMLHVHSAGASPYMKFVPDAAWNGAST
ncbi:hypothetical protein ACROSR_17330 [Roseovarius tibetensis]|uniref:hypothetical protein n=1 Tax=Roseovarius tibetensis TaxID=2685897 RepID=UPI003D7F8C74